MASIFSQLVAAGRLRLLASGEVDLADEALLAKAVGILAEFTPEERQAIGAKAVELGADAATITALINIATGETVEVTAKAPRRNLPWWWLAIGGAAAIGVGGVAGLRARRSRRAIAGW